MFEGRPLGDCVGCWGTRMVEDEWEGGENIWKALRVREVWARARTRRIIREAVRRRRAMILGVVGTRGMTAGQGSQMETP